jgi:uncharacterized membrane protein YtjA (UPF0391 family)
MSRRRNTVDNRINVRIAQVVYTIVLWPAEIPAARAGIGLSPTAATRRGAAPLANLEFPCRRSVQIVFADSRELQMTEWRLLMFGWMIAFLVLALVAAVFGFGGIAAALVGVAQVLFVIFVVLFVAAFVRYLVTGRSTPDVVVVSRE